jgi:hypothetical protein
VTLAYSLSYSGGKGWRNATVKEFKISLESIVRPLPPLKEKKRKGEKI